MNDGVHDSQKASLLGPCFGEAQIMNQLDQAGARYRRYDSETELLDVITDHIVAGKVVGHVHGRMEFGPRALGARSIIGDARSPAMQSIMNLKIKFRESFRPFAPCVLRDHAHEWFDVRRNEDSPYMLLVADVNVAKRTTADCNDHRLAGVDRLLKVVRSQIPAVTHVDYSARIQTVDERHGRFYRILKRFHEKTDCPVLINTSFNIRGEPIVCSPTHAYRCFLATNMDVLVVENFVLMKDEQPTATTHQVDDYMAQFDLD
jgi:carbamoyltransferase